MQHEQKPPYGLIAVLMVGAFIAILNNTLMNVALPVMMEDLNVGPSTIQWLATGFMLVNGVLIPATAFLIQKYSVRKLFLAAMILFTAGTVGAGFAHEFWLLLAGRMVQASGSAILMPLLMNVMLNAFPIEKRGSALGLFGLVMMGAPAIGPTLSGWIVENYDWRMLFHFITPIAAIVLIAGFFLLKKDKETGPMKLDFFSVILSCFGFGGILYGFSSAGNKGWDSPHVYLTLIIGVVALFMFIRRQLHQDKPMLDFRIYQFPLYALSSAIMIIITMAMFSGMILTPIYVQTLRGISPLDAGLLLLPGAIIMALMSPISGKLFDKFGGKILAIVGLSVTAISSYFFSQLDFDTPYSGLIVLYAVRMFGMSLVMMPVQTNGLNQLPARFYPHGTAMNSTLNQVSGAIGTALLVTVMTNVAESRGKDLFADAMAKFTTQPTQEQMATLQQQVQAQALLEGINFAFLITVFIAVAALILSFFMKRATQAKDPLEVQVDVQTATDTETNTRSAEAPHASKA